MFALTRLFGRGKPFADTPEKLDMLEAKIVDMLDSDGCEIKVVSYEPIDLDDKNTITDKINYGTVKPRFRQVLFRTPTDKEYMVSQIYDLVPVGDSEFIGLYQIRTGKIDISVGDYSLLGESLYKRVS